MVFGICGSKIHSVKTLPESDLCEHQLMATDKLRGGGGTYS